MAGAVTAMASEQSAQPSNESSPMLPYTNERTKRSWSWQKSRVFVCVLVTDTWTLELLALGFSIASSITICVLLAFWDGKPPPPAGGITFNAIISALATASKSAMLFVVGGCVAQSKWLWFHKRQPLSHIQFFDDASRGPLGAMFLLCNQTILSIASVGAWIMILALAFDPFIQQALSFPSIPRSVASQSVWAKQGTGAFTPSRSIQRRTLNDAYFSENLFPQLHCPESDCGWPISKSLAYCHVCKDVTPVIVESFTFPQIIRTLASTLKATNSKSNGITDWLSDLQPLEIRMKLGDFGTFVLDLGTALLHPPYGVSGSDTYILDLQHLLTKQAWPVADQHTVGYGVNKYGLMPTFNPVPAFAEFHDPLFVMAFTTVRWNSEGLKLDETKVCSLSYCVRDYNQSVVANEQKIAVSRRTYGKMYLARNENSTSGELNTLCWRPDDVQHVNINYTYADVCINDKSKFVTCDPCGEGFWPDSSNHGGGEDFTHWLTSNVTSNVRLEYKNASSTTASRNNTYEPILVQGGDWTSIERGVKDNVNADDFGVLWSENGPEKFMSNIADGLTNQLIDHSDDRVYGSTIRMTTIVSVQWYWLILPALLNFTAAFFLASTIHMTRRHQIPLWKSSLTTVFFHGLEQVTHAQPPSVMISEIDKEAEGIRVRLGKSDRAPRMCFSQDD